MRVEECTFERKLCSNQISSLERMSKTNALDSHHAQFPVFITMKKR